MKTTSSSQEKKSDAPSSRSKVNPFVLPPVPGSVWISYAHNETYKLPSDPATDVFVPKPDPDWFVDHPMGVLIGGIDAGENVLVLGDAGVGKTDMIKQMCAVRNWPYTRVPLSEGVHEHHLFGRWSSRNGTMEWLPGPVQVAMEQGHVLLLDEIDVADPAHLIALRGVLETNNRFLRLLGKDGSVVRPHPQFRVVATANSIGNANRMVYSGTTMMNIADVSRFGWTVYVDHFAFDEHDPNSQIEVDLVCRKINSQLKNSQTIDRSVVIRMVKLANKARESFKSGTGTTFPFGVRDVLHWAKAYMWWGNAAAALDTTIRNKVDPSDQEFLYELFRTIFPL